MMGKLFSLVDYLGVGMNLRQRVAREAAFLLYRGIVEEYKQAKEMAAQNLGAKFLPSNLEVALALDEIAEEMEGEERRRRLLEMRRTALKLMESLSDLHPRLIGSVWRGTAHRGSDIDIVVYAQDNKEVVERLRAMGVEVEREETSLFVKTGIPKTSDHLYLHTASGYEVEIIVRPPWEEGEVELCEIYGDLKVGLNLPHLRKILEEDPLRRFIPWKRR